ncbi:MAG: ABC transporter ATP-binding protein [Thermoplasmata archaeon]
MSVVISCDGISKSFDGKKVLENIKLDIMQGEIFSIIGPNGSGKTTLIRILATLERQDKGIVKYFGVEMKEEEKLLIFRRKLGYVQQKAVLFAGRVYDNLAIPLKIRNWEEHKIDKRVEEVAEKLGIKSILSRNIKNLSGGEAQRVAFGRAIVAEPQILFLDEFTANLDYRNAGILEQYVKNFVADKRTVVMVSHNIFQVKRLASRTAILFDGKIIEQGETKRVLEGPENPVAKDFVCGKIPW